MTAPRARAGLFMLAMAFLISPPDATAQAKLHRVGLVSLGPPEPAYVEVFHQELQRLGYVDGRSLELQTRFIGEAGIQELLRWNADVLVAMWSPAALAAKRATSTVPIVVVGPRDPVEQGLVQSLARPGGNVTGLSANVSREIPTKRLQILKELVPQVSRVAFFTNLSFPGAPPHAAAVERAGSQLGVVVQTFDVRGEASIDEAFSRMVQEGVGAALVAAELGGPRVRKQIIALAARHRLPVAHSLRVPVEEGGLVAYDIDRNDLYRRAAAYVDRILKGTKPAELPVEQPTKFELVINLRTVKALGLTVPRSLLLSAEVIQ